MCAHPVPTGSGAHDVPSETHFPPSEPHGERGGDAVLEVAVDVVGSLERAHAVVTMMQATITGFRTANMRAG